MGLTCELKCVRLLTGGPLRVWTSSPSIQCPGYPALRAPSMAPTSPRRLDLSGTGSYVPRVRHKKESAPGSVA